MSMPFAKRKSEIANGSWLPDMDLNHDKQIQSLLCYRYTIGQWPGRERKVFPRRVKPHNASNDLACPRNTASF